MLVCNGHVQIAGIVRTPHTFNGGRVIIACGTKFQTGAGIPTLMDQVLDDKPSTCPNRNPGSGATIFVAGSVCHSSRPVGITQPPGLTIHRIVRSRKINVHAGIVRLDSDTILRHRHFRIGTGNAGGCIKIGDISVRSVCGVYAHPPRLTVRDAVAISSASVLFSAFFILNSSFDLRLI